MLDRLVVLSLFSLAAQRPEVRPDPVPPAAGQPGGDLDSLPWLDRSEFTESGGPWAVEPSEEEVLRTERRYYVADVYRRAASALRSNPSLPFTLLQRPEVAADLKLTPAQADAIRAADRKLRPIRQQSVLKELDLADIHPDLRAGPIEAEARRWSRVLAKAEDSIRTEVLQPDQAARLKQLVWQERGLEALIDDAELARLAGLTPKQRGVLRRRHREAIWGQLHPPAELTARQQLDIWEDPDRTISNQAGADIKQHGMALERRAWAVLTDRNRQKLQEALGPPPARKAR